MIKRAIFVAFGLAVSLAATMVYRPQKAVDVPPVAASRDLDMLAPEGALLYIQARNFSGLLKAWNDSPEKAEWLQSSSLSSFSQSRLFLRLQHFFQRFGEAAGMPADMDFLTNVAGDESALALYDIGKIQFVYITHLPSREFLHSDLWQARNKLQSRFAGNVTYFLGSDERAKQVVTFAIAGDYLVLATREDLMVRTLQLLDKQPDRSLAQDSWYSSAVAAAPKTRGDLRMVLDLKKITVDPHFRTYWIQQNITEMQEYTAAVSDLYCQGNVYREERVLLRNNHAEPAGSGKQSDVVAGLLRMVPSGVGFYQAQAANPEEALEAMEDIILPRPPEATDSGRQAPNVLLTSGEVGSESDLETRIDVPASKTKDSHVVPAALKKQFDQAGATAYLEVQGTQRNSDGALLTMPHLMVFAADRPWDASGVREAVQSALGGELSVSSLGLRWHDAGEAAKYFQLDGLHPLYLAVRDKLLYVSNQAELLTAALYAPGDASQASGSTYIAGFNHARERENFYEVAWIMDRGGAPDKPYLGYAPAFFSRNIGGLSKILARLESEKVVEREEGDKVYQTVTYTWSQ